MSNLTDIARALKKTSLDAANRANMILTTVTDVKQYGSNGRGFHAQQIYKYFGDEAIDPGVAIIGIGKATGVGK